MRSPAEHNYEIPYPSRRSVSIGSGVPPAYLGLGRGRGTGPRKSALPRFVRARDTEQRTGPH